MLFRKIILLVGITLFLFSCDKRDKKSLTIFHAGSLSIPFQKIAVAFEQENPTVKVLLEPAGSRTCARKISDLKRKCDIMASADYSVINRLLIPDYADWNIRFASNEMSLVYRGDSKRALEITKDNWHTILMDNEVKFGRSDPNSDPCGYRAIMTIQLQAILQNDSTLIPSLLTKNVAYMRPKEVDLLALLESHVVDYIFLYRSVAQQHRLPFLELDSRVNLKESKFSSFYKRARVEITGNTPETVILKKGSPMVYGITIPKSASEPELAEKFIHFLFDSEKGMKIMEESGQPSVVPSFSSSFRKLPPKLSRYAKGE